MGGRLARADDLGVQDAVEDAGFHQRADLLALDLLLPEAGQLFVHAVDAQRDARDIRDEHSVGERVQNAFEMLGQ